MQEFMLIYKGGDPDWHVNATEEDMAKNMQAWEAWMSDLSEKGQLISGGDPLHYEGKRLDANKLVTDIAASEFKELVSGYSVVAAANIDAAVEIAKSCPIWQYPGTTLEVRQIQKMA